MKAVFFAFDVETTGLDADEAEIISLAAVLLDGELNELKILDIYAHPEKGCPAEAARINGYTEEKWKAKGALSQEDFYNKLSTFIDGCWRLTPVGHNVSFDIGFLKALYKKNSSKEVYDKYYSYHALDTLGSAIMVDIAKHGKKAGAYQLGKLCTRFGIDLGDSAHDAKEDIRATVELFRHLILTLRGDTEIIPPKVEERKRVPLLTKTGETTRFNRGKFEGKTLEEVAEIERGYLMWVAREITDLPAEVVTAVKALIK